MRRREENHNLNRYDAAMEVSEPMLQSMSKGWWDVCGRKRRAAEDYLIKYPLCLNDSIWIKLEICERNQKWRFWNKRSFLGSGNKLKYVLSSFGKEKKRYELYLLKVFLHNAVGWDERRRKYYKGGLKRYTGDTGSPWVWYWITRMSWREEGNFMPVLYFPSTGWLF